MNRSQISLPAVGLAIALSVLGAAPFAYQAFYAQAAGEDGEKRARGAEDEANPQNQLALAPPENGKKEKPTTSRDPYSVPNGDVQELMQFIRDVQRVQPKDDTEEAQREHETNVVNAVVGAAEKILAQQPDDEEALAVANVAFQALWHLVSTGDEDAPARIDKLMESLKNDKRRGIAELVMQQSLIRRIQSWKNPTAEQRAEFVKDVKGLLGDSLSQDKFQLAMQLAEMLEQLGDNDAAAGVYEELVKVLPKTPQGKEIAERFEGTIRRLKLPGNFMEVKGTTLDGHRFDWESYRGKVVLVDFWATWCGPCIRELPNVLANYEKYHDRGFDVVGISLDDDLDQVREFVKERKIPWMTLAETDADKQGWNNPLANYYGISGIPAVILVDKEGKVVSLDARGEELGKLLAKLLGDVK